MMATVAVAGMDEDFIKAVSGGDLPAVKTLLAKGGDLNGKYSAIKPAAKAETKEDLPDVQKGIETIRKFLSKAAGQYQGCKTISEAVGAADALLDSYPDSSEGYYLLGDALELQRIELCYFNKPAKHARTPANAFSTAYRLNPSQTKYLKSWAFSDPESEEVAKILDSVLKKDPTNAFAAYMVARRSDTPAEKAIELLSGTKGCEQSNLLGELLEKRREFERARNAYKIALHGPCEGLGIITWHGDVLRIEGQTRFKLARVSFALGDIYESLRQLRFVQWLTRDAAIQVVDFEEMAHLENQLAKQLQEKPVEKPGNLHTPGEVIMAFEKMSVLGDAKWFEAHTSSELRQRVFRLDSGAQACKEGDAPCLIGALQEFLPWETTEINCGKVKDDRVKCSVGGGRWKEAIWNVELVKAKGAWQVVDGEMSMKRAKAGGTD